MSLAHCKEDCPGCGMTFSPDPASCPLEVFIGWKIDVELTPYDAAFLKDRGAKFDEKGTVIE